MRIQLAIVVALALAGCASAPLAARPPAIAIDHMIIPAVAEIGGPVAAYAGLDNDGEADRADRQVQRDDFQEAQPERLGAGLAPGQHREHPLTLGFL